MKSIYNSYVYNLSVSDSLHNFNKKFKRTRAELEFESGVKANNCKIYNKLIKTSRVKEGVNNFSVKSEYLICDALILLNNQPYIYHNANTNLVNLLANKLNLYSFPSSLRPRLNNKNTILKKIAENNLIMKGSSVVYETADGYYKIELIAKADINSNKRDDWLL